VSLSPVSLAEVVLTSQLFQEGEQKDEKRNGEGDPEPYTEAESDG
jgi:hypothetical protein